MGHGSIDKVMGPARKNLNTIEGLSDPAFRSAEQNARQFLNGVRFLNEIEPVPAFLSENIAVAGGEHDGQTRVLAANFPTEFYPAHPGHDHIGKYDVEAVRPLKKF